MQKRTVIPNVGQSLSFDKNIYKREGMKYFELESNTSEFCKKSIAQTLANVKHFFSTRQGYVTPVIPVM